MKRLYLMIFSAVLAATPVFAAAPAKKPEARKPAPRATPNLADRAPADRYFGKMKMSFLGINNTFRDATILAGPSTTDSGITNKIDFAEDALADWAKNFPREPQLARSYFLEERALKKIWIKSYQDRAWSVMKLVETRFPTSYFGKQVKKDLAAGFTAHYYATPAMCIAPPLPSPTPAATPVPEPSPAGGRGRKATPAPAPVATPEPTPAPTATPVPGPIATSDPRGYKVSIEPVACEEKWIETSPSPSAAPTATPLETPAPVLSAPVAAKKPAGATPAAVPSPLESPSPTPTPTPAIPVRLLSTGDATFNDSAIAFNGTRIPIVFGGMVPASASFMPLPDGDQLRMYRILLGRDVSLKGGAKLCSAVPTFMTVRRAPAKNAYDIFVTFYKGTTPPTGASSDATCGGAAYSYPAM